jgi:hypothetical protein
MRIKIMLKNILTFTVLLLAISAIGFLFFPANMLAVVGITGNDQLNFLLRTSAVGVISLIPSAWAVRTSTISSPVNRAVLLGLAIYMFLSSIVDYYAFTQSLVNNASIPSMAFRVLLGITILVFAYKK